MKEDNSLTYMPQILELIVAFYSQYNGYSMLFARLVLSVPLMHSIYHTDMTHLSLFYRVCW